MQLMSMMHAVAAATRENPRQLMLMTCVEASCHLEKPKQLMLMMRAVAPAGRKYKTWTSAQDAQPGEQLLPKWLVQDACLG